MQDDSSERGSCSPDMYTDSEISCSEQSMEDHNLESADDGYHGEEDDLDPDDDPEYSGTISESSGNAGSDVCSYKVFASCHPEPFFLFALFFVVFSWYDDQLSSCQTLYILP